MSSKHMILNLFFYNPQGDYRFSWRHPDAPQAEIFTLKYYTQLAKQAEEANFDAIFIADHMAVWDSVPSGISHYANTRLEPITLLSALAAVTDHIGLMGTASTSYNEPYNVARYFASLDFLSNGRASWNVVTSWQEEEAANFGLATVPQHAKRYQRAEEFVDVVTKLWDSWEDEAILYDKKSGLFADTQQVHALHHQGEFFKVRGPLNVPRPPQGHPLIVQAGSSESGKDLAAARADMHFVYIRSIEDGLAYRQEINQRLVRNGRDPQHFKIVAGVLPIVVDSEEEITQRQQLNQTLMHDQLAIDQVSSYLGADLSQYPWDKPLQSFPDEASFDGIRTKLKMLKKYDSSLTLLELGKLLLQSSDSLLVIGNAEHVAQTLIDLHQSGAVDGFNLQFPLLPGDFNKFTQQVIPLLKQKGAIASEYAPGTLRERFGIPRPDNQFSPDPRLSKQ